jgi:hypothetical protein
LWVPVRLDALLLASERSISRYLSVAAQPTKAYYSRPARRLLRMVWVALWVFYAVVVGWAWVGAPIAGAVLLVAVVAAQGWVAMTLLRMGVYVYDDHLLIRSNIGRTTNVAWSDIEGFELGTAADAGASYRVAFARLRSGDTVRLDGTTSSRIDPDYGDNAVTELETDLAARR